MVLYGCSEFGDTHGTHPPRPIRSLDSHEDAHMPTTHAAPDVLDPATREARARAEAGEPLNGTELGLVLRIKHSRFHLLAKAGAFDQFKLKPAFGTKCYSGVLVWQYVNGLAVYEQSFGRKRRRA